MSIHSEQDNGKLVTITRRHYDTLVASHQSKPSPEAVRRWRVNTLALMRLRDLTGHDPIQWMDAVKWAEAQIDAEPAND